jgi:hypothetical protein
MPSTLRTFGGYDIITARMPKHTALIQTYYKTWMDSPKSFFRNLYGLSSKNAEKTCLYSSSNLLQKPSALSSKYKAKHCTYVLIETYFK